MADNSFADEYQTGQVNVGRSAVRHLNAATARVEQSAVQRLTAGTVEAANSAVGFANGATLEFRESAIGVAAGDYVKVDESRVFLLLAPRVSGNVKAYVTLPAAFALGAGYFCARQLARAIFGRGR
jgi:hypothetical protein